MLSMLILIYLRFWPVEITTEFLVVRMATVVLVFVHDVSAHPICYLAAAFRARLPPLLMQSCSLRRDQTRRHQDYHYASVMVQNALSMRQRPIFSTPFVVNVLHRAAVRIETRGIMISIHQTVAIMHYSFSNGNMK